MGSSITMNKITWYQCYGNGDANSISEFEIMCGQKFPNSYNTIVTKYNGAYPRPDSFKFYSKLNKQYVVYGVGIFLPFGVTNNELAITMEEIFNDKESGIPNKLIPFSNLGNGDLLCFDYRDITNSLEPSIVVWHHDADWYSEEQISFVSKCFDDFLDTIFDEDAIS